MLRPVRSPLPSLFACCLLLLATNAPAASKPRHAPQSAKHVTASKNKSKAVAPTKASAKKASTKKLTLAQRRAELKATAASRAATTERVVRLNSAFTATTQLRPMAQQLSSTRSPASFAGVTAYAQAHPGVQAATAYLALGHAYAADKRYPEAVDAFHNAILPAATPNSTALADYADYLGAQALLNANRPAEVPALLTNFAERHPESIFVPTAPLLLANAWLLQKNPAAAVKTLEPLLTPEAHADLRLALARAYQAAGDTLRATQLYRLLYTTQPLTFEATQALPQLQALGQPPTAAERKLHADTLFNAKRYAEASADYHAIRNDPALSQPDRDALEIYSAVCDLKLKRLSRRDAEKLPTTSDDTAALKLYLLAEISRTEKDRAAHTTILNQMVEKYPRSRWLEEASYSGGNMYLLTHDYDQAILNYKLLYEHFPTSIYAPSAHWRVAWMTYRQRHDAESGRLMDEQVTRYPASLEASSAIYWRGRIYEESNKDFPQAANYYRALTNAYPNFYYGYLARQRLAVLGTQPAVTPSSTLASVRKLIIPDLAGVVPEDDPHYIKAKLLANAALNEYIGPEIAASPGAPQWGALAQAEIYASYGENTRALQSMKKSGISFFSLPPAQVPTQYWNLMFPKPYWSDLVADSQRNGLDPYLVASLIRQESEFNPGAVSPAHAYGLMQLLPSVGKENAKREGMKGFSTASLLNPTTNLQLGTRNLRGVLDRFGGQPEYALAAYNAGDVPVRQWMAVGTYRDIAEFVESIPYTETREYVQAILRNREMYRLLYAPK